MLLLWKQDLKKKSRIKWGRYADKNQIWLLVLNGWIENERGTFWVKLSWLYQTYIHIMILNFKNVWAITGADQGYS